MTVYEEEIEISRLHTLYDTLEDYIEDHDERIRSVLSTIKSVKSLKGKGEISKLTKILKSVSSTERLFILLVTKQLVTFNLELEYILELSQPKANHHIQKLINSGIIDRSKEGRINILSITQIGKIFAYFVHLFINDVF